VARVEGLEKFNPMNTGGTTDHSSGDIVDGTPI
jgi:hypothetical protein